MTDTTAPSPVTPILTLREAAMETLLATALALAELREKTKGSSNRYDSANETAEVKRVTTALENLRAALAKP